MSSAEWEHLDLLAEVDALMADLDAWADDGPPWPPARAGRALVTRLRERVDTLRVRWQAPLVVATFGGTGAGKSALINALVGEEVAITGRQRPTTRMPVLICRPEITPQMLGMAPETVEVVHRHSEALADLVLLDCPDPDTSESEEPAPESAAGNLARLRELLPHCDVLLVVSTQQKYRSACVEQELAAAAAGARLVFVQTHADVDDDIRADWRDVLADQYQSGEMFFVDSLAGLADARAGVPPRGDFGRLVDLLTQSLAGAAAKRIRRVNFLELAGGTLDACAARIDVALPTVEQLEGALTEQRQQLATRLASTAREELTNSRRAWEDRLLGEVASRWGLSPFAGLLRAYQGLGSLLGGAALARIRSPMQMAIWGAAAGGRALARQRRERIAAGDTARAVSRSWDPAELRTAAIILQGYAGEVGLPREEASMARLEAEAESAGEAFVASTARQLQEVISREARRHTGWFPRLRYELLFGVMLVAILFRLGKNFFYDSWLAEFIDPNWTGAAAEIFGWDFFVHAAFWLVAWSALLLWLFSMRLRRGLRRAVTEVSAAWKRDLPGGGLFSGLEDRCRAIRDHRQRLESLIERVRSLRRKIAEPEPRLGHRTADPPVGQGSP